MLNSKRSFPILTKFAIPHQILIKVPNIRFRAEVPPVGDALLHAVRRTDGLDGSLLASTRTRLRFNSDLSRTPVKFVNLCTSVSLSSGDGFNHMT